jgi:hypothetical protein
MVARRTRNPNAPPERRDYGRFWEEHHGKADDFNAALDAFINVVIPTKISKLTQKIALKVFEGVTKKTPVDTGRARANWNIALGKEPDLTKHDGEEELKTRNKDGNATVVANGVLTEMDPLHPVSVVISNNVEYIGALERGHSDQAPPHGIVGLTLDETRVWLESETAKRGG